MDMLRLRSAAGDAARCAQSVLKSAAAHSDRIIAEMQDYRALELFGLMSPAYSPEHLRATARQHVLFAVAYMDAARQQEARQQAAAEQAGGEQ